MFFCFCFNLDWKYTWSSLLVCRRRCLRKLKREHFRTRMRSVVPSARWAAGERPLGLRGQAQLMLAAFIARNFPRIVLHSPLLSGWKTKENRQIWLYLLLLPKLFSLCAKSLHIIHYKHTKQNKKFHSLHSVQCFSHNEFTAGCITTVVLRSLHTLWD